MGATVLLAGTTLSDEAGGAFLDENVVGGIDITAADGSDIQFVDPVLKKAFAPIFQLPDRADHLGPFPPMRKAAATGDVAQFDDEVEIFFCPQCLSNAIDTGDEICDSCKEANGEYEDITAPTAEGEDLSVRDIPDDVVPDGVLPTLTSPVFSHESDEYIDGLSITISQSEGATIMYDDGGGEALYSGAIQIDENTTLTAWATKDGYNDSPEVEVEIDIKCGTPSLPSASPGDETEPFEITITPYNADDDTVYYVYGTAPLSDPIETDDEYTAPFILPGNNTVKAIEMRANCNDSDVDEVTYDVKVKTPAITLPNPLEAGSGAMTIAKVTTLTPDAIKFTIEGVDTPKQSEYTYDSGTTYDAQWFSDEDMTSDQTITIKAWNELAGYENSVKDVATTQLSHS